MLIQIMSLIDLYSAFVLLFFTVSLLATYGLPRSMDQFISIIYSGRIQAIYVGLLGTSLVGLSQLLNLRSIRFISRHFRYVYYPYLWSLYFLLASLFGLKWKSSEQLEGKLIFIGGGLVGQSCFS